MKRRFDWRAAVVLAVVLGVMAYVGVALGMLVAELRPLLTSR